MAVSRLFHGPEGVIAITTEPREYHEGSVGLIYDALQHHNLPKQTPNNPQITTLFQSLTAHAADPNSNLIITLTTGQCLFLNQYTFLDTAVLIMMVPRPNSSF